MLCRSWTITLVTSNTVQLTHIITHFTQKIGHAVGLFH